MMYREFDSEPVKDTCEESGVHYVNPTRIFTNSDEADTIGWMYRNGKRFHVTEAESDDGTPTRKQIYLPKRSSSDSQDDDDGLSEAWEELYGDWEFEDVEGEPSEGMSFSRLLSDIRREEEVEDRKQKAQNEEVDTARTVVFETNHPYVTPGDTDDQQMDGKAFVHVIERVIRWYRRRWGHRERLQETQTLHGANHLDRTRLSVLQLRVRVRPLQRLAAGGSTRETHHRRREQVIRAAGGREPVPDRGRELLRSRSARLTPDLTP